MFFFYFMHIRRFSLIGCPIIYNTITKFDTSPTINRKLSLISKIVVVCLKKNYGKMYDVNAFYDAIQYIKLIRKNHFRYFCNETESILTPLS